jgi:hypothetical protein
MTSKPEPQNRFYVSAGEGTPTWAFTYGISGPDSARRYYAEVTRTPLERVILTAGEPTRDRALENDSSNISD